MNIILQWKSAGLLTTETFRANHLSYCPLIFEKNVHQFAVEHISKFVSMYESGRQQQSFYIFKSPG